MAEPVITVGTFGQSKTSGTSIPSASIASRTWAVGDILVAHLIMDPSSGTVTFNAPSGGGTWAGWVVAQDQAQGSGTSGVRTIVATNRCTAGGTFALTLGGTMPTTTAKALIPYYVTGCDSTTWIAGSAKNAASTGSASIAVTIGSPGGNRDAIFVSFCGAEVATGTTFNAASTPGTGWDATATKLAASTSGTSGSSTGTNVSGMACWWGTTAPLAAGGTSSCGSGAGSGNVAVVNVVFRSPLVAITGDATETVTAVTSADGTVTAAPPPQLVGYAETSDWTTTGSKSTPSISWQAGDLIVIIGGAEGTGSPIALPTATGLTFSPQTAVGSGSQCWANSWTATAGSDGSSAVTSSGAGANEWGMAAWVFRNSAGTGGRAAPAPSSSKTVSLSRQRDGSAVVLASFDYSAAATTGYSFTPSPVANDREHSQAASHYSVYVADWSDQGAAGTLSYGTSGETSSGPFTTIAIEITPPANAASVTAPAQTAAAGMLDMHGSATVTATAATAAAGTVTKLGTASCTATASTSADGTVTPGAGVTGDATVTATASTSADGTVTKLGSATASPAASTSAAGYTDMHGSAAQTSTATSSAAGTRTIPAGANATTVTTQTSAAGTVTKLGSATATVTATTSVAGTGQTAGTASVTATATTSADGTTGAAPVLGQASVTSAAQTSAAGTVTKLGDASKTVTAVTSVAGTGQTAGTAAVTVTAATSAAARLTMAGTAAAVVSAQSASAGRLTMLAQAAATALVRTLADGEVSGAIVFGTGTAGSAQGRSGAARSAGGPSGSAGSQSSSSGTAGGTP